MLRPIIVVDDDSALVMELRQALSKYCAGHEIVGPPDLPLDLRGVRENLARTSAVVLDLNIGGSSTYGRTLLKSLRGEFERLEIPVVVWSKYFKETVIFGPADILKGDDSFAFQAIAETDLERFLDYREVVRPLRKIYRGTRAFVTKCCVDPVNLLLQVLSRIGVFSQEL